MSVQCIPPILWLNVAPSSKNEPVFTMLGSVIVLCLFFLTLGHARSHLCHVRSVCFFHLVCFTHLVDKRGALEQERTSLYHLVSVKVLCVFFLTLGHARSHLCHVRSVCFFHLVCFTHLVDKRGALEQERTSLYHLVSVKVLCVFFLSLEQARSHLCHVGSVCSSHLVCSTHLADKRGPLEQARPSLYHVGSVKVFCETGGVSWQLARFWKLASDKSLGEKLKICSLQFAVGKALGVGEGNKSHL